MKRTFSIAIIVLFIIVFVTMSVFPNTASAAGTTLSAGDIVFVGINSDGDDEFSLLLLRDIADGTSFYITDKGWNGSGFADNLGDGIWQWTASSAMSAGDIIHIKTTDDGIISETSLAATPGTVIWIEDNSTVISYMGDQVFLYQGTHTNPTLIAGVHYNVEAGSTTSNWDGAATSAMTSALPDQLTNGTNAIWLYEGTSPTERDNFIYNGSTTTGTPDELRTAIYNLDNWNVDATNATAYTLKPYPYTFTVLPGNATPTISTNSGLTVTEGSSGSLQSKLTATDSDGDPITYTVTTAPSHGSLSLSTFTQAQLDAGSVTYTHDGSNTTSDSFVFTVSDGNGGELANQTFSITVTPVDDTAPTVSVNTGLGLDEGATKSITTSELSVTDEDSDDATLTLTVTTAPTNGQMENTDNPGVAISSFTQQDINDGKIQYVHDGSNTLSDSFGFKVSDGTNELTAQTFAITVTAVDDDAPTVSVNTGLSLDEGATAAIPDTKLAAADTEASDTELAFTITTAPTNGQLENTDSAGVAISSFTQQNLSDGKIQYVHDDSNTTSDSFVFKVSDGTNELTAQVFSITVTAVDDDTPTITTNSGLELSEGATKTIPLDDLEADDTDSDNAALIYTVTAALTNGQLENTDNPGVAISSFTQQNLIDGKIQYVHDGSNTTSDSFVFKVSDGTNELTAQTCSAITVTAVDDDTPTITTNSGLELSEGATKTIPLDDLEADDTDSDNAALVYTVTTAPVNGQLENTDNPGVAISSFTQQNLSDGKIQYVHDGSNTLSDSFGFKIADTNGNELTAQTFAITVTPVDDDVPTISVNDGLTLEEGATAAIPATKLAATDTDSNDAALIFTVTTAAVNGQLENTDSAGVAISSFTQQNLSDGKIQYVHDGSDTTSDSFVFTVSDGTNELTAQTFSITVTPVDEVAPEITTNSGLILDEGGSASLAACLAASDAATDDDTIIYTVTTAPDHGSLSKTVFTQAQLDAGSVAYTHDGSNTTADSFGFKIADTNGNELTAQTFSITVTAVDDDAPAITTNSGLVLDEGGSASLAGESGGRCADDRLAASDTETDNGTIIYTVTTAPGHGSLSKTAFTQAQLDAGSVVYTHDDSNTTADSFGFKIADTNGNELTAQTFSITVKAVDDDTPTITTNSGLTLDEGGSASLATHLAASDTETDNGTIIYTVTTAPGHGSLSKTTFTQAQLDAGSVVYTHDDSNTTADSFGFKIADTNGNELTAQTFSITVKAVDDDAPTITTNSGLTLDEGGSASLATHLAASDTETDDDTIIYTVTDGPNNGSLSKSMFTQAQLDAGSVVYTHDDSNTTSDSFVFKAADTNGNELTGQTFSIRVNAVDDDTPTSTPTATPTQTPTATSTPTPTPTATPTSTPTATATPTTVPSEMPANEDTPDSGDSIDTIIPSDIEEDEETGTVTVEINVSDLPAGTASIKLPNGDVIEVTGSGTVQFTLNSEDMNSDGAVEIVALDGEGIPLGSMAVKIADAIPVASQGSGFASVLLWILIGIGGLGIAGLALYLIMRRRSREKNQ